MAKNLLIDKMIEIDDNGMPIAPTVRQLLDKDIKELYTRDKSKDKNKYIQECIVIYYLGDPKSPANQAGLSNAEALRMAIDQAGLDKSYIPDTLVLRLIKRYYEQNISEAGKVVENILKAMHNINLMIDHVNSSVNEKLQTSNFTIEELPTIMQTVDSVNKIAGSIPSMLKKLEEAKQNLMYEKETELSRGGNVVMSSMDVDNYDD